MSQVKAEDLYEIYSVTDPNWSPDGEGVIFVNTMIDQDEDRYTSNLYYYHASTEQVHQWTYGNHRTFSPRWSPDGTHLAFLSTREGKTDLYVLPVHGGEAKKVTNCPNGISNPIWSPSSEQIAFEVVLHANDLIDSSHDNKKEKEEEPKSKVIDRMKYKLDGKGIIDHNYQQQIALVDIEEGDLETVTDRGKNYQLLEWSADQLLLTRDDSDNQDFSFNKQLGLLGLEGGNFTEIETPEGYISSAAFSPSNQKLAMVQHTREYENATHANVIVYDLENGMKDNLTSSLDLPVGDYTSADIQQGTTMPGVIWQDNECLYFPVSDHGSVVLYFATLEGELYPAWLEEQHIYGFDLHTKTQRIAGMVSDPEEPGEMYVLEVPTGKKTQATFINQSWLENKNLPNTDSFIFTGEDGQTTRVDRHTSRF